MGSPSITAGRSGYADSWKLTVNGHVANELNLSYTNITALGNTSVTATLKCVEGPSDRAVWTGVRVKEILDMSSPDPTAREVVFHAADGYSSSLTMDDAMNDDVLLAYGMNGETLPPDHGYPLRLVVPGKYGYKWVKWIVRIELVDYDYQGYWERRGWDDEADIATFNEWSPHAALLSISFVLGGLALASGFKQSDKSMIFSGMPDYLSRRFHTRVSALYLLSLLFVFLYWCFVTYSSRGSLFYTIHGVSAALVVILHAMGGLSRLRSVVRRPAGRAFHRVVNQAAFMLLTFTILTGFIRIA